MGFKIWRKIKNLFTTEKRYFSLVKSLREDIFHIHIPEKIVTKNIYKYMDSLALNDCERMMSCNGPIIYWEISVGQVSNVENFLSKREIKKIKWEILYEV